MPQRGRRSKRERERERRRARQPAASAAGPRPQQPPAPAGPPSRTRRAAPPANAPSPLARATGFAIAIVTFFAAAVMFYDGATGDYAGIDHSLRIIGGALMMALALFVGALVLFPLQLRSWFQRRSRRG